MKWKLGLFLALSIIALVNSGIIKRQNAVPAKETTDHEVKNITGKAFECFMINKLLMNQFLMRFGSRTKLSISFQINVKTLFRSIELITGLLIDTVNFKSLFCERSCLEMFNNSKGLPIIYMAFIAVIDELILCKELSYEELQLL